MNSWTLFFQILTFSITVWLGLYLLARDYSKTVLRLSGFGLISYSLAIAFQSLIPLVSQTTQLIFLKTIFIYFPAVLWTGVILSLIPDEHISKQKYFRAWRNLGL
ncbi:MAG: hypothetical protein N2D54_09825, partial [Chloroflexota bacterium]